MTDPIPCPITSLGGPPGEAAKAVTKRLLTAPFSSLAWLRADLTGETVSEFDEVDNHTWYRPFKNFSGDISGRFLEVMALLDAKHRPAELVDQLIQTIPGQQHPDGSFAAYGPIDWDQPIDHGDLFTVKMMPALWGNSRLLCCLVAAAGAFKNEVLLQCAKRLGDFYGGILPRFADAGRMGEYSDGGTFAAGYATCYFPAMEGLVKLHQLCGGKTYLDTALAMAAFYANFDAIPIDHSHGMLCCHVSLLLIYESTGQPEYLELVEARWEELVAGGYINPAGGILEKCRPVAFRDEGCALVDWLRLNLELARLTGKDCYWAMAERVLLNHLLQNQCSNGGFGHRNSITDECGLLGFSDQYEEATWCCCFHGLLGFELLENYLCSMDADRIRLPLALDFGASVAGTHVISSLSDIGADGELFRQTISFDQPARVSVRRPAWADDVTAVDKAGNALVVHAENGWLSTRESVAEVTWVYCGGEYHEPRRIDGHTAAVESFSYRGPWLLSKVDGQEPVALSDHTRDRTVLFHFRPGGGPG